MDKLLKFLNGLSKEARDTFAASCGTSVGYLRKAVSSGQSLSAATCVAVERESKYKVTRKDLRPDDWQNIWPELASSIPEQAAIVAQDKLTGEPHDHA